MSLFIHPHLLYDTHISNLLIKNECSKFEKYIKNTAHEYNDLNKSFI